ncbi:MAG: suppressor of fused domain protein [Clostridiales bacterium]|nr:suppressor of fused domain protein [Clostridiales bacterium]
MKKEDMGEEILNHYEKFLGIFEEYRVFKNSEDMPSIQLLQYDNGFNGCKTYASFGMSKFSTIIKNTCESILIVDNDFQKASYVFANVLFYIIENNMRFDRGTHVAEIENVDKEFALKHNKDAIYFTETYMFPEAFSWINGSIKMYLAFFISQQECNYIKKYGCEKFEDYLEEQECDIVNGLQNGIEKLYYDNTGELERVNEVKDNMGAGLCVEYYKNSKISSISILIDNLNVDAYCYNEEGKLEKVFIMDEDNAIGIDYVSIKDKIPAYRQKYNLEKMNEEILQYGKPIKYGKPIY